MNYPKVFPDEHDIKLVLSDQCQVNYNTNIQQVPMWKQSDNVQNRQGGGGRGRASGRYQSNSNSFHKLGRVAALPEAGSYL